MTSIYFLKTVNIYNTLNTFFMEMNNYYYLFKTVIEQNVHNIHLSYIYSLLY